MDNLYFVQGRHPATATRNDLYLALAYTVRDRMLLRWMNTEQAYSDRGAKVVAADGVGNGDQPENLLMRRMVDAFAGFERRVIGARTKAALAVKKARGERVGGIPYGESVGLQYRSKLGKTGAAK